MKYTHFFDVRLARQFESDIEDFDEAFDAWASSFPSRPALRAALLDSDESTKTICQGVIHSETLEN